MDRNLEIFASLGNMYLFHSNILMDMLKRQRKLGFVEYLACI